MIAIKEVFKCSSGSSDITEEFIYQRIKNTGIKYKVLSSSVLDSTSLGYVALNKDDKYNTFENQYGILVVRNGNAGEMRFLDKGNYITNDHAYILTLKPDFKEKYKIDEMKEIMFLKYFIYTYGFETKKYSTNNDNSTWNKTSFFKYFEIEDYNEKKIEKVFKQMQDNEKIKESIDIIKRRLEFLRKKIISIDEYTKEIIDMNKVFDYCSRNDCLSEEGIYNRSLDIKEPVIVLSGSTDNLIYGKISKSDDIHYIENKQVLHVITRGKAGKITYIEKGDYATNTNAFMIYLKDDYKKDACINNDYEEKVVLKAFQIYLQPVFYEMSSNADVSVLPLTEIIKNIKIPLFKYSKEIEKSVLQIEKYDFLRNQIQKQVNLFENLSKKNVIFE